MELALLTIKNIPSELTDSMFMEVKKKLFDISDDHGYACFDNGMTSACLLVLLSGQNERFGLVSLLRRVGCPVLMIQDPYAPWYTGSKICSGFDEIESTIRSRFPQAQRFIFVGQSSGGYAALVLSRRFESSTALVFSPQTFDDKIIKRNSLFMPPAYSVMETPDIKDIAELFRETKDTVKGNKTYIIVPETEVNNPPENYFWCDTLHWTRMVGIPGVKVIMGVSHSHAILFRNTKYFAIVLGYLANKNFNFNYNLFLQALRTAACGISPEMHASEFIENL